MKTQFQPPAKMVRGVFDDANATDPSSVYPEMKGIGGNFPWNPPAPVYLANQSGIFHHKYILIDADLPASNPIVETGSFNYSTAGTTGNDENILMIYDSLIANQYYQEFVKRYSDAGGTIKIEKISSEIPANFILGQNYPNPFNPKTIINYDMPSSNYVKLTVYNALGKEVVTLVNEIQTAGSYKVTFDASNLTSGVYFYHIVIHSDKLETNRFIETKRMVLIK